MKDGAASTNSMSLRILRSPLTRLVLLGGPVFFMMGLSSGFMEKFRGDPVKSIAAVLGMAMAALAFYVAYARLVERRPANELSLHGAGR
ncbi:MAG TPA: CPBP family intramembrane metalloprotease, partial [Beijerinckiaceae bacterium]|nr:CPBP family intramembrane metalloprotease [Beijerinckiaceae bacterium]